MRRKMARIILATIILAGVMALLLASCGGRTRSPTNSTSGGWRMASG